MKKTILIAALLFGVFYANAQTECGFKYGANEDDSVKCRLEITQFNLQFKAQNYAEAYNSWQYLVNHCPCSWSGLFANAPKMLESFITTEKDSVHREVFIDSLLWVYDNYAKYHPNYYTQGRGIGFKAYYTMKYRANTDYEKAFDWFITSVEMEKEETQPIIWNYYFLTATQMAIVKQDTNLVIEAYERANEYIDDAIVNAYERFEYDVAQFDTLEKTLKEVNRMDYDKEVAKLAQDTTRQKALIKDYNKTLVWIENKFIPYAPCEVLERVYTKKVADNHDNIPVLQKIILTMNKGNCQDSPIFREALSIVHQSQPSSKTAEMMGNLCLKNKEYDQAIVYLNESIALSTTNERKAKPYFLIASIHLIKGNLSEARANAYNVLKINPNDGQAYILIGDCYMSSAGRCNSDDPKVINGAVYWAAADKYNKAAAVDPSVASVAASRRASLPGVPFEEVFKKGYDKGQTYHVGCWINENTTIR